jgi:hypothetical protein
MTGNRLIPPLIVTLGNRRCWVVSLTPRPFRLRVKRPGTHWIWSWVRSRAHLKVLERKICCPSRDTNSGSSRCGLITRPSALSQLRIGQRHKLKLTRNLHKKWQKLEEFENGMFRGRVSWTHKLVYMGKRKPRTTAIYSVRCDKAKNLRTKLKVKQCCYRPGQALRVPGGWGTQT